MEGSGCVGLGRLREGKESTAIRIVEALAVTVGPWCVTRPTKS